MNLPKTFTRAATLLLCASVFAGTALAGDKPADGAPGNSANAPGQQKKAEETPQPAPVAPAAPPATPPGQAKPAEQKPAAPPAAKRAKAEKSARAATPARAQKPAKAEKPVKSAGSGSYKATSSGDDLENDLDHKHTICHATGSATNPYVVITPSISGVHNGHLGHQGDEDIVPPYTYKGRTYSQNWDAEGQALFASGCRPAAAQTQTTTAATTTADCPGTTRTVAEVTRGGVFHRTGNGYVFIQPSPNSAHHDASKHPDDIVVPDQTVTRTVQVPGDCSTTTTTGSTTTVTLQGETVTLAGTTTTVAGSTVTILGQTVIVGGEARVETAPATTTTEAGGVLGAQSPPDSGRERAGQPEAGGVLGAVASLGQTATSGSLPFTGIPLWVAALVGGGLLFAGFALRRAA